MVKKEADPGSASFSFCCYLKPSKVLTKRLTMLACKGTEIYNSGIDPASRAQSLASAISRLTLLMELIGKHSSESLLFHYTMADFNYNPVISGHFHTTYS